MKKDEVAPIGGCPEGEELAYDDDCPLFYPLEPFQFGQHASESSSGSRRDLCKQVVPEVSQAEAANAGIVERSEIGPTRCYRRCEGWYCLMTRPSDEPPNHCVMPVGHEGRCLCLDCLWGLDHSDEEDRQAPLPPGHRALAEARSHSADGQAGDGPTGGISSSCVPSSSQTATYCIHCWDKLAPPSTQCALCFARVHEVCFEQHWSRCDAPVPPPPGPPPARPPTGPPPNRPPPGPPRAGLNSEPAGTGTTARTTASLSPAQTGLHSRRDASDVLRDWIEAGRESLGAYEAAALQASLRCAECWKEATAQQCILCEVCDSVVHVRCAWPHHLRCRAPTARQRATSGTVDH